MTTQRSTRLRVIVLLPVLLFIAGLCLETPVLAAGPRVELSVAEGDPGDGVLRPELYVQDDISNWSVSGTQAPVLDEWFSSESPTTAWSSPPADFYLVPIYLPGGAAGQGTLIFLPRSWSRFALPHLVRDGRWHHVP